MDELRITVLDGDETGQELLDQALRVLDPGVTQVAVEFERFDLSLENRRRTNNEVVSRSAEAMSEASFGIKAATITPEGKDDVGSPNRLLREAIDGKVIIRTGRRIPGVTPGIRRPVRMMTLPSISSRRIRFGLPTSSAPSGVIVAAFSPNRDSRIAFAASMTTSFLVVRRFSSERSKCSTSTGTWVTLGSITLSACSSSSWPVSSPSRTVIFSSSIGASTLDGPELDLAEMGGRDRVTIAWIAPL